MVSTGQKRQLGTRIQVTEMGYGGASMGNLYKASTDKQARKVIKASWDLSVGYFDTAPEYGHGLSELSLICTQTVKLLTTPN